MQRAGGPAGQSRRSRLTSTYHTLRYQHPHLICVPLTYPEDLTSTMFQCITSDIFNVRSFDMATPTPPTRIVGLPKQTGVSLPRCSTPNPMP